jgi:hypothetical protein
VIANVTVSVTESPIHPNPTAPPDTLDPPHRGMLAVKQEVGTKHQRHRAYCEEADEQGVKQVGGDPLPLTNPEGCLLTSVADGIDDQIAKRNGPPVTACGPV